MKKLTLMIALSLLAAVPASAGVLDDVLARGTLNCGTDNTAPGFGYLNTTTGKMEGLDVDFCRAVAAAVLGDAEKVNYVIVTDKSRFIAVQTGQVDVVFAHTTVKPGRESAITVDFLPIMFWDGTGAMVSGSDPCNRQDRERAQFCKCHFKRDAHLGRDPSSRHGRLRGARGGHAGDGQQPAGAGGVQDRDRTRRPAPSDLPVHSRSASRGDDLSKAKAAV